jgi:hypothetical protein
MILYKLCAFVGMYEWSLSQCTEQIILSFIRLFKAQCLLRLYVPSA